MPELHSEKDAPSNAHSKVEPGSLAEKWKAAVVSVVVAAGPSLMVVSGGVVSAGVAVAVAVGVSVGVGVGGTGVAVGGMGVAVAVFVGVAVGSSSTIQVWLAGEASALPAASLARTTKVCGPIASSP